MATPSKKIIKKKFFTVKNELTGKEFELYGDSLESLKGRFVNLDMTRNLRGKGIEVRFKINVKNNEAYAEPTDILLLGYFIRRMMRKGSDYVEDSITCECKNAEVIIKPFILTRKKVSRAIRNSLRVKAREWIIAKAKTLDNWELFDEVLKNKFQKDLSLVLKKVYPLSLCEIRMLNVKKINQEIEYKRPEREMEKTEIKEEVIATEEVKEETEHSKPAKKKTEEKEEVKE